MLRLSSPGGNRFAKYAHASDAETTAVAMYLRETVSCNPALVLADEMRSEQGVRRAHSGAYERMVMHAASAATHLDDVFSRRLYLQQQQRRLKCGWLRLCNVHRVRRQRVKRGSWTRPWCHSRAAIQWHRRANLAVDRPKHVEHQNDHETTDGRQRTCSRE
jgi:hypothetical protein